MLYVVIRGANEIPRTITMNVTLNKPPMTSSSFLAKGEEPHRRNHHSLLLLL